MAVVNYNNNNNNDVAITKEEMGIDERLGYPRAYAKLCKDSSFSPYSHGPPFTFFPFTLQSHEGARAKDLDEMFPIIDPQAKPTAKTRIYVSLLWKQLNHLGNAGFDPAMFRVDPYGNVVYFHADSASPLAWDIDHWFPCSRGGLSVPSNLRILQWQVCKRKHNQLEFLVPWWDLQLGISINQFLSIFAASNSDFRHRAFRLLFTGGENEELNDVLTVDSHNFPQPFMELKDQLGLAPAAIVRTRRESFDASTLRCLDLNRQSRPSTLMIAPSRKMRNGVLKENEVPDMVTNPYQAIVMARDSLKQRDETKKMKAEIQRLDDEVNEMRLKNEEEKLTIQELELALIKHRRKAEKCRRLAESQSSYKAMLEKMIRNAMHQSVVYKEQVRLNQAATNTLMARLEAQMAICNSAEKELHERYKLRDELEKQIRPQLEQARKRSRTENDEDLSEERGNTTTTLINLPRLTTKSHLHKELRMFLEEEQRLSQTARSLIGERLEDEPLKLTLGEETNENVIEETNQVGFDFDSIKFPFAREPEMEEDEQSRKERGKGNVEKWLQMLLGDNEEDIEHETSKTDNIIKMLNEKYPQQKVPNFEEKARELDHGKKEKSVEVERKPRSVSTPGRAASSECDVVSNGHLVRKKDEMVENDRKPRSVSAPRRSVSSEGDVVDKGDLAKSFGGKEKGIARCESARSLKSIPYSPSKILNMRKGVDCMRKKPLVIDDEDDDHHHRYDNQSVGSNLIKSSLRSIKRAVKM